MKPSHVKFLMRVMGTLAGLFAIGMLLSVPFMFYQLFSDQESQLTLFSIIFLVFQLAVAAYFVYAAYLVWFKMSPLAVRHICGSLGFILFSVMTDLLYLLFDSRAELQGLATLGGLIVVYFAYRACSDKLIRALFQEETKRS